MPSNHERRITALETRVAENEQTCSETRYKHQRRIVRLDLNMGKLLHHFNIAQASDHEVEEALDAE